MTVLEYSIRCQHVAILFHAAWKSLPSQQTHCRPVKASAVWIMGNPRLSHASNQGGGIGPPMPNNKRVKAREVGMNSHGRQRRTSHHPMHEFSAGSVTLHAQAP